MVTVKKPKVSLFRKKNNVGPKVCYPLTSNYNVSLYNVREDDPKKIQYKLTDYNENPRVTYGKIY